MLALIEARDVQLAGVPAAARRSVDICGASVRLAVRKPRNSTRRAIEIDHTRTIVTASLDTVHQVRSKRRELRKEVCGAEVARCEPLTNRS
jgi:hypothetical protein